MPRFFTPTDGICDGTITIRGDDARHIARALRMAEGDTVTVCDMQGREHICRLCRIRDEECTCLILETREGETEPPVYITLYMAYPKGDKLETVIQKAVELGASRIIPFESSRCIKRPKAEKTDKLLSRLSRIAEEAAKQCGRGILPAVSAPLGFEAAMKEASEAELSLFCYEGERCRTLRAALCENRSAKSISVTVGAEGGFSPDEARRAEEAGLVPVSLGPRILRCETAPLYALAAISYELEL